MGTCTGEGFKLELVNSGRCCAVYECICDRTSCPCVDQPTCDVGEKLQVTNPGECCPQYKCMCDAATCPATNDTKCSFGHKLKQVVDNSKCCPVSTECICDATMCPLYIAPPCDVSKGLKRVATSTRWTHPRQMACCPKVYEEVCSETGEVYTTCTSTACVPLDPECPQDKIRTTEDGCCQSC